MLKSTLNNNYRIISTKTANFSFTYVSPPTKHCLYISGELDGTPFLNLTLTYPSSTVACVDRVSKITNAIPSGTVSQFYLWLFNKLNLTALLSSGRRSDDAERFWEKLRSDGGIKKWKAVFKENFQKESDDVYDLDAVQVIVKDRSDTIWGLAKTKEDFDINFKIHYNNPDECPWDILQA